MQAANMNNMANSISVEDVIEILRNRIAENRVEEQPTVKDCVEVRVLAQWLYYNGISAYISNVGEITEENRVISDFYS